MFGCSATCKESIHLTLLHIQTCFTARYDQNKINFYVIWQNVVLFSREDAAIKVTAIYLLSFLQNDNMPGELFGNSNNILAQFHPQHGE